MLGCWGVRLSNFVRGSHRDKSGPARRGRHSGSGGRGGAASSGLVSGLGFRWVRGSGFRVWGLGLGPSGLAFRA